MRLCKGANLEADRETNKIDMQVQQGLNNIYLRHLSKVSLVMFFYYSFISISHVFVLEGAGWQWIVVSSVLAAGAGGAIHVLIRLERISAEHSQLAFVPVGLSAIVAVFAHVFFSEELLQLTNGGLIMFAIAFVTLSPMIFGSLFLISSVFYWAALVTIQSPDTVHFAFMYVAVAALTILCFVLRYRTLYSAERLLISNRNKAAKLVEASKRIQENIDDVRASAEAAERANAAKDVFLANTTHELRTPLTGVLGMMDFLAESNLDEDQRQAVDAAQFSARTLLVVVNDLLDIAKLDAGKLEIKAEPFMPATVVAQVVDLLKTKAESKGLVLSVHGLKRAAWALVGDPVRIGQIVLNLTDNAIKFTDEGEVVVAIKIRENSQESALKGHANLRITVQDSGPGISEEDQKRLFSRFEQLDGSAARSFEGAGLGLSICLGLANQMGGRITVDSETGMGSTFCLDVDLPIASTEEAEKALAHGPTKTETRPMAAVPTLAPDGDDAVGDVAAQGQLRVLLAEDNAVNQLLVRKLAKGFSWNLTVVNNGEEAIFRIEDEDPFDLVLMDIRMPKMDGVQAIQRIRSMSGEKGQVPVIALTANTGEDQETVYKQQGMSAIVGKPIDSLLLKSTADKVLAKKKD